MDALVLLAVAAALLLLLAVALLLLRRRGLPSRAFRVSAGMVDALRRDVDALCAIGERNTWNPAGLDAAADLIHDELRRSGWDVERQSYVVPGAGSVQNLIVEKRGRTLPDEIVVIGAHYDTVAGTAGADDNASGMAVLFALARKFASHEPSRTLRFVAFVNEEPPHFQSAQMGSWQYARRCRERRERIVGMISIEAVGYFDDARGSQQYPVPLAAMYPDTGNFIAFVSNVASRPLLTRCVRAFRSHSELPVESAALPQMVPGVGWSDQWAFWELGWPALMVTDTAPFRNPHYHAPSDVPDTLDYGRLALVVAGLEGVVAELAD